MKQRLGIAQTLLNDPKLIILDEPTIGLDPNTVKELRNFLISVARKLNIAILISSRSEADVKNLCDTIAILENGKITKPVKGATLVGSGKDVLLRIDMIADNLSFGYGMCGSESGSVPTIVGQPTIRVSHMTVGGKGGNK